jgi:hypothetical protein
MRLLTCIGVTVLALMPSVTLAQSPGTATVYHNVIGAADVSLIESWIQSANDGTFTVRIARSGSTSDLPVPSAVGKFSGAWAWGSSRLIILIDPLVTILDLAAGAVVDQFLCDQAFMSPDHRFVSYLRYVPRWSEDEQVLLVYDVSQSPSQNRMGVSPDLSNKQDVGVAIFPEWNRVHRAYTGRRNDVGEPDVSLRSPQLWTGNVTVSFAAGKGDQADAAATVSLWSVDVAGGSASAILNERPLDGTALIDIAGYEPKPANAASVVYFRSIQLLTCGTAPCPLRLTLTEAQGRRASSIDVSP